MSPFIPDFNSVEFKNAVFDHRASISAASGSVIATIAGFPLDSVKSRLQVQRYPSLWNCIKCVYREEGVSGFFRGVYIPLISITIVRTTSFTIYHSTKTHLQSSYPFFSLSSPSHSDQPQTFQHHASRFMSGFLGGAMSGALISCGSCGFELVKIRAQLEYLLAASRGETYKPVGTFKGFEIIYQQGGLKGLYSGFPLHMIRDSLGTGLYFSFYDSMRFALSQTEAETLPLGIPRQFSPFLCGSAAGVLSWAIIYPIDATKTRYQRDVLAGHKQVSAIETFEFLRRSGVRKLYRGLGVSALRSCFTHGLMWVILEETNRSIREWAGEKGGMRPDW